MQKTTFKLKTYDSDFSDTIQLCCGNGRAFYTPYGSALLVENWSVTSDKAIAMMDVNFILTGEPKETIEEIYKFLGEYGSVEVSMERDAQELNSTWGGASAYWNDEPIQLKKLPGRVFVTNELLRDANTLQTFIKGVVEDTPNDVEPKKRIRTKRVKVLDMNKPRRKFDFEGAK